jgi:MoCo/4Fe-4S cofactor protein with predicted Tat translocation signal
VSKIPVELRHDFTVDNTYWRSRAQLDETPEFRAFVEREFANDVDKDPVSRRSFLKLMGASAGLAGFAACRRPVERILPYSKQPEEIVPGTATFFATTISVAGQVVGALVETHEGRPTKVEGNPQHPASLGASDAFMQASILGLYDPDRAQSPVKKGQEEASYADWDKFASAHFAASKGKKGAGLAFLFSGSQSPTFDRLRAETQKQFPEAKWFAWQPVSEDASLAGAKLAFGKPAASRLDVSKADVILALDSDFLGTTGSIVDSRAFAARRAPDGKMNRLYAVEANYSVTGGTADHRLRVKPSQVHFFARALVAELVKGGLALPSGVPSAFAENAADASKSPFDAKFLTALASDLLAAKGNALVVVGPGQPAEVHALAAVLNAALGAVGTTVSYRDVADAGTGAEQLKALAVAIEKKEVETLVIIGGNPAYDAPANLKLADRIATVPTSVHLSPYLDETGAKTTWTLPLAHTFETWGDAVAFDGTYSVQQPLILPLFGGRSEIELLGQVLGFEAQKGYDLVRDTFKAKVGGEFERAWRSALNAGVVPNTAWSDFSAKSFVATSAEATKARPVSSGFEVAFIADASMWDGRFANNAWLQEVPDPMTKLTWDNAALLSPASAEKLGVKNEDLVKINTRAGSLEVVVWVMPGLADETAVLALGYGRNVEWSIANGVGFNAYTLRSDDALGFEVNAQVTKAAGKYELANTQDHHFIAPPTLLGYVQKPRPVFREGTLDTYKKDPGFADKMVSHPALVSLNTEHVYLGKAWAMSIDLNACTGCNVCTIACQAENNIAVVGKDQVRRGREMHWIRLDRYFANQNVNGEGEIDVHNPRVVHQPMTCQHCENAPCEQVCPVTATVHGVEGTNDMQYSRCIGTKYCSNNCPYKVRRFNYHNFHENDPEVRAMAHNPDVTVRMRGVMEKCSYCVQRINRTKLDAKVAGRALKDGDIKVACEQACPSGAIVFGDMNDKTSRVAQARKNARRYDVLAELNTKPRTTYLARIRNPNPVLG